MIFKTVPLVGAMIVVVGSLSAAVGCTQDGGKGAAAPASGDVTASVASKEAPRPGTRISGAVARKIVAGGAYLLDVRTAGEFSSGHIDGAANISVQSLSGRMAEVGADKNRQIVVYCRSGARSSSAMRILQNAGFTRVYDLGPRTAW